MTPASNPLGVGAFGLFGKVPQRPLDATSTERAAALAAREDGGGMSDHYADDILELPTVQNYEKLRQRLAASGLPYIIENVVGAGGTSVALTGAYYAIGDVDADARQ